VCHSFGFGVPVMWVDFSGVFTDQSVLPTAPIPHNSHFWELYAIFDVPFIRV
jgi:hypothetical protein